MSQFRMRVESGSIKHGTLLISVWRSFILESSDGSPDSSFSASSRNSLPEASSASTVGCNLREDCDRGLGVPAPRRLRFGDTSPLLLSSGTIDFLPSVLNGMSVGMAASRVPPLQPEVEEAGQALRSPGAWAGGRLSRSPVSTGKWSES